MTVWTIEQIADRFQEAAATSHQLPAARLASYATSWPEIARQSWEGYADAPRMRLPPASPDAIDRFIETTRWLQWLEEEQRLLIWARARFVPWRVICQRRNCPRQTAWRHWKHALTLIVVQLNGQPPRIAEVQPNRDVT